MAWNSNMGLNTFATVVKHYESIKPVLSNYHSRLDDLRPIAERTRKWENIRKISDTKYALADVVGSEDVWAVNPPIVWELASDGSEYVTVTGALRDYGDYSRLKFLSRFLPCGINFDAGTSGAHTITTYVGGEQRRHYLPRNKQGRELVQTPDGRTEVRVTLDNVATLRFKRDGTQWELVSEPHKLPKQVLDKHQKAKIKPYSDAFYEWVVAVAPILPVKDWSYNSERATELRAYLSTASGDGLFVYPSKPTVEQTNKKVEILKDSEHPLRIALACNFLSLHDIHEVETDEDRKKFRSAYNLWVNKNFTTPETKLVSLED